ncbi:MAG: sensor histidine kinase [Verrucomicrobiia bacterium]
MSTRIKRFETWSKQSLVALCLGMVAVVGFADYLTGYEIFVFIFYLVAVFLAVWFVGFSFGVLISALSVMAWISTNIAAGERYSGYFVPVWNAIIMFVFYLVVVVLLTRLRTLHKELEERVIQRTVMLTNEIQERTRLQKELLETSERVQRRIGYDLHDGLCQHLTGTALAGQVLGQKLANQSLPEAVEADRLVELIEEAIELTRTLARSLHPLEIQAGRLADSFQELASGASERFKVACQFDCHQAMPVADMNVATQFYRIAQEAITNAVRHGKAGRISLRLESTDQEIVLTIMDDGIGLPENARNGNGLGLRIMAYRACMIGATFGVERLSGLSGTRVTCKLAVGGVPEEKNHVTKNQSAACR